MSVWKKLFGTKPFTRDVPNGDYHAVEVAATKFLAHLMGQRVRIEINILIPSYNKKDYGGDDEIVEAHYSGITHLGHFERMTIKRDTDKRGCVTLQIDPCGNRMTEEDANKVFDVLSEARDEW